MEKAAHKSSSSTIQVHLPGLKAYAEVWQLQKELLAQLLADREKESVILCQHFPVITFGKSSQPQNLLLKPEELKQRDIDFFAVERGGDVSYHEPGQLLLYPILNLRKRQLKVADYMHALEEVVIRTLSSFDIVGIRAQGKTGVWTEIDKAAFNSLSSNMVVKKSHPCDSLADCKLGVEPVEPTPRVVSSHDANASGLRHAIEACTQSVTQLPSNDRARNEVKADFSGSKIASMGVRITQGCTMHGLALNVNNSLKGFSYINPCGFRNIEMTSVQKERDKRQNRDKIDLTQLQESLLENFFSIFGEDVFSQSSIAATLAEENVIA